MKQFIATITSLWDKIVTLSTTLIDNIKSAVTQLNDLISWFPQEIIIAFGIVILILVIYKILGR